MWLSVMGDAELGSFYGRIEAFCGWRGVDYVICGARMALLL